MNSDTSNADYDMCSVPLEVKRPEISAELINFLSNINNYPGNVGHSTNK